MMLTPDPAKRITLQEALTHPWFTKYSKKTTLDTNKFKQFYNNIITLKTEPKYFFQHATFAYMVHNLAKKEDLEDIRKLFDHFDDDGNGNLKTDEIINGFEKMIPNYINAKELRKNLKFLDQSDSGLIEYEGNLINLLIVKLKTI